MLPISSRNSVPPRGLFDQAFLAAARIGKCAGFVAEQFALQQRVGQRRAIQADQVGVCARGLL